MIDLHIHSNFSDGTYDVNEILKIAQNIGCEIISIVDHNTCEAYKYLKNPNGKFYKGKIISGCECNTFFNHIPIELLGYDFDPELLQTRLEQMYKYSEKELQELEMKLFIENCNLNKVKIATSIIEKGEKEQLSRYLYRCLKYYPENVKYFETKEHFENPLLFYRCYMSNPNSIFFCNMEQFYPKIEEIVVAIRKAGGKVFIPHIYEYKSNAKEILIGLISLGYIDGVECFYSKFTVEQRKIMNEFAEENHLLKSGGSDCHSGKHIKIGEGRGDLKISQDMLGNWVKYARNFNYMRENNER